MSWSRRIVCCGFLLAGCGYRPLYGERGADGASVVDELALVRIEAIPNRIGQQLYNLLRERLNPQGKPGAPKYALKVTLTEQRENLFLEKDETATRANLTLKADFTLSRIDGGSVIAKGLSRSVSSYDILASQFASVVSEEDALLRGVRVISDDIKTRVALALSAESTGG